PSGSLLVSLVAFATVPVYLLQTLEHHGSSGRCCNRFDARCGSAQLGATRNFTPPRFASVICLRAVQCHCMGRLISHSQSCCLGLTTLRAARCTRAMLCHAAS